MDKMLKGLAVSTKEKPGSSRRGTGGSERLSLKHWAVIFLLVFAALIVIFLALWTQIQITNTKRDVNDTITPIHHYRERRRIPKPKCRNPEDFYCADISWIIDQTNPYGLKVHNKVRQFITDVTSLLPVGEYDVKMSAITFSSHIREIYLTASSRSRYWAQTLKSLPLLPASSRANLFHTFKYLISRKSSFGGKRRGHREGVPMIAFFLSDGYFGTRKLHTYLTMTRNRGINVEAIAYLNGRQPRYNMLRQVVPRDGYLFNMDIPAHIKYVAGRIMELSSCGAFYSSIRVPRCPRPIHTVKNTIGDFGKGGGQLPVGLPKARQYEEETVIQTTSRPVRPIAKHVGKTSIVKETTHLRPVQSSADLEDDLMVVDTENVRETPNVPPVQSTVDLGANLVVDNTTIVKVKPNVGNVQAVRDGNIENFGGVPRVLTTVQSGLIPDLDIDLDPVNIQESADGRTVNKALSHNLSGERSSSLGMNAVDNVDKDNVNKGDGAGSSAKERIGKMGPHIEKNGIGDKEINILNKPETVPEVITVNTNPSDGNENAAAPVIAEQNSVQEQDPTERIIEEQIDPELQDYLISAATQPRDGSILHYISRQVTGLISTVLSATGIGHNRIKRGLTNDALDDSSYWTKWTSCTLTCGGGIQARKRICLTEQTCNQDTNGRLEFRRCNLEACSGELLSNSEETWKDLFVNVLNAHDSLKYPQKNSTVIIHTKTNETHVNVETGEKLSSHHVLNPHEPSAKLTLHLGGRRSMNTSDLPSFADKYNFDDNDYFSKVPSHDVVMHSSPEKYPNSVYPSWSPWSAWSMCSSECGNGEARRKRTCKTPYGTKSFFCRGTMSALRLCVGTGYACNKQTNMRLAVAKELPNMQREANDRRTMVATAAVIMFFLTLILAGFLAWKLRSVTRERRKYKSDYRRGLGIDKD